jgi:hypothetical protein
MKYLDTINSVCGEDWDKIDLEQYQGGLGVAMTVAFMKGCSSNLNDLSWHLRVPVVDLALPYARLEKNGVFDPRRWLIKEDQAVLGHYGDDEAARIWAYIAAVSSGFLGQPAYVFDI